MDHSVVRAIAERAAAAGLVALRFDVSGVRDSEGDVHDWESHLRDLDVASASATESASKSASASTSSIHSGLPRFGAGFSYGARLWMERMLRPSPPPVVGLLLLAPATRVPKTSRDFGDLLLGRPIRDAVLDERVLERLRSVPVPSRVIVGENDNVAPPNELRAHASPTVSIDVLAGLNHFFSRSVGAGPTDLVALHPALDRALRALLDPSEPDSPGRAP